jgi:hypothetical protein
MRLADPSCAAGTDNGGRGKNIDGTPIKYVRHRRLGQALHNNTTLLSLVLFRFIDRSFVERFGGEICKARV